MPLLILMGTAWRLTGKAASKTRELLLTGPLAADTVSCVAGHAAPPNTQRNMTTTDIIGYRIRFEDEVEDVCPECFEHRNEDFDPGEHWDTVLAYEPGDDAPHRCAFCQNTIAEEPEACPPSLWDGRRG